jgi:hypothetical protein
MRILGDSSALKINVLEISMRTLAQMSRGRNYVELPSMEEVDAMEKQQSKAIESLEISDGHVKCQECGTLKPIITDDTNLIDSDESKRIHRLRAIIKQIERQHIGGINSKKEKQELAELLEQEKRNDIFRRLPLYSSCATGYRWFCSTCYDKAYSLSRKKAG